MENIGLIMGGGGAKGAYQIGVWKALKERGLENIITGVSGTSVGALNGIMFVSKDINKALNLWKNLRTSNFLLSNYKPGSILLPLIIQNQSAFSNSVFADLIESYAGQMRNHSIFSNSALWDLIDDYVDFWGKNVNDTNGDVIFYTTTTELSKLQNRFFYLNDKSLDQIKKILLASSAIPMVFPLIEIDGVSHADGGLTGAVGNIPIFPLYNEGFRKFIVITIEINGFEFDYDCYDCKVVHLNLGRGSKVESMLNTLNFTPEYISALIKHGYEDMMKKIPEVLSLQAS